MVSNAGVKRRIERMKYRRIIGCIVGVLCILGGVSYALQEFYFWAILWTVIGSLLIHSEARNVTR